MSGAVPLGSVVHSFFVDHLVTVKGLRPATIHSYRDTIRLFLFSVAADKKVKITKLCLEDLSFERTLGFLRYRKEDRRNHVRTRNQRLAACCTRCSITSPAGSRRCSVSVSGSRPSLRKRAGARRDALPRA